MVSDLTVNNHVGTLNDSNNTKILCYADDALVLVLDVEDLSRLKQHVDVFCRASNAKC
jgi:hypothetical protein